MRVLPRVFPTEHTWLWTRHGDVWEEYQGISDNIMCTLWETGKLTLVDWRDFTWNTWFRNYKYEGYINILGTY